MAGRYRVEKLYRGEARQCLLYVAKVGDGIFGLEIGTGIRKVVHPGGGRRLNGFFGLDAEVSFG